MQRLLYAIAALLLLAALPYLLAFWVMLKRTFRCLHTENTSSDKVPVHLKAIFQTVITELEQYGFRVSGYYLIERIDTTEEGKDWSVLVQHKTQQTYVLLKTRQLSNVTPVSLLFTTFFTNGCQLDTVNSRFYGIFSQNPKDVDQYLGTVAVGEQWQAHQRQLAQLSETKNPRTLSPEAFIATLEDNSRANVERLVQNREVYWVKLGASYRLTWWTTLKSVFKVVRRRRQERVDQSQTHFPFNETTVDSVIELEVDEFYRRQQRRQGFSRPAKHWLLLGTLALFIASYSSVFKPQKLVIFIAVLLLHEGGHVLAMELFGYRDTAMLFVPFLGALATARKHNASLTERVWVSLAGPLPGLLLGIGLAIAFSFTQPLEGTNVAAWFEESNWVREASWMLVILNLFNLLPIYPLDGGQVADLLLFSRSPYLGVLFKGVGVLLLGLFGLQKPLMLMFAVLIGVTIPSSFRLAKLNTKLRRELRLIPSGDEEHLVRLIFGKLQVADYRSLPFAKKHGLVLGLLESHREGTARWTTRVGLSFVYLTSLIAGIVGGLYVFMPNRTLWTTSISQYVQGPAAAYQQRMKQELERANRVLQVNPRNVEAYLQRGRARLSLQDYTGVIADANQILRLDPNSSKGYGLRDLARRRLGDVKGAETDREKARSLTLTQSIQRLNRSLSQNPKDVNAYLARASAWSALGNYKGAIADCNQVLRLNSQNVEALLNRGDAYLQLKDYKGAIADANQVLSLHPTSVEAYDLRSGARRQLGDQKGAIADEQKSQALERS